MDSLVNVSDFEEAAKKILPKNALDYYASGAGGEFTLKLNKQIFSRYRIRPRFLKDVSKRDLSTTILGAKINIPIGIAPTAMQKMAHPVGECGNAAAAEKHGTIFILSTIATSSIEEVAESAKDCIKWFQLYIYKDRQLTLDLVRRAEKSGFSALVLTVDAPFFGIRYADARNKFQLPQHLTMANFTGIKATQVHVSKGGSGINEYVASLFDPALTWDDISWLKRHTKLPIVLKGILTAEDAKVAVEFGVNGIIVSNHGARQVDSVPASLEALPEIVSAVGDHMEVYMDGGIRSGTDIFIALALGAKMVFVGRPALWGLVCGGQLGVEKILGMLKNELESVMALTGCATLEDVDWKMIIPENLLHRL